jgi:hypothetical protein
MNYTIVTIVPPAKEEVAVAVVPAGEVPVEGVAPAAAEGAAAAAPAPAAVGKGEEGKAQGK